MFPVTFHGIAAQNAQSVQAGEVSWFIPEEVPIALVYNRRNYAVMMGTPDNLVDFAVGFSLTEEVIKGTDCIKSLEIYQSEQGADLRFKVTDETLEKLDITLRRRNMVGSSSCGLCGLENADMLFKTLPRVTERPVELSSTAMALAIQSLDAQQPLNQQTRSVHAAAWVSEDGNIEMLREDVGRHNALDKLLGAMAFAKTDVSKGFVLMSSRCSYEIIEKAARRDVKAILSISGPTAFALRKAKEANISVYSRLGKNGVRLL